MVIQLIKSLLLASAVLFSQNLFGQDTTTATSIDARYVGVWKGNWVEGMSSGKATVEVTQSGGQVSFTSLPSFGAEPAALRKIKSDDAQLGFQTSGANGRAMRFELKLSGDRSKLNGKGYYEGLHMEVELTRVH